MLYERKLTTTFRSCTSITADVNEILAQSGVQEGLCVVSVPHTTAGLAITSFWDPRGLADLMDEIDRNLPTRVSYRHQDSPYDASGHVKSALMGSSAMLIIHQGKLILGSSQGLVFVEFDGPRPREFWVEIIEKPLYLEKRNIQTVYMGMHDVTAAVEEITAKSGVPQPDWCWHRSRRPRQRTLWRTLSGWCLPAWISSTGRPRRMPAAT